MPHWWGQTLPSPKGVPALPALPGLQCPCLLLSLGNSSSGMALAGLTSVPWARLPLAALFHINSLSVLVQGRSSGDPALTPLSRHWHQHLHFPLVCCCSNCTSWWGLCLSGEMTAVGCVCLKGHPYKHMGMIEGSFSHCFTQRFGVSGVLVLQLLGGYEGYFILPLLLIFLPS